MAGDIDSLMKDLERRMAGAVEVLHKEFGGLRAGRASTSLLDSIVVSAYGSDMPLNQVGNVSVPEPRLLTVQVWDQSLVGAVEKAIQEAGLGLNPGSDGQLVRVPIPPLSEERRVEMSKIAGKYAEQARVAVRNVRRDGMENLKKMERDGDLSKDEHQQVSKDIQSLTDAQVEAIDQALQTKESEIMQV
jgi:ribosome recycling factor